MDARMDEENVNPNIWIQRKRAGRPAVGMNYYRKKYNTDNSAPNKWKNKLDFERKKTKNLLLQVKRLKTRINQLKQQKRALATQLR